MSDRAYERRAYERGALAGENITLAYRRFGHGAGADGNGRTPILAVHGLSYFSYDWIDVASALASDREVVAIDMRGFGDSSNASDGDYSIPSNARDFVRLCDHFGWPRVVLLGHSMGARHCLYCAGEYPARVAALVALDFAPTIDPRGQARVAAAIGSQPDMFPTIDACIEYSTGKPAAEASDATRERFKQYTRAAAGGVALKRDLHFRNQFKRILETGQRPPPGVDLWQVLSGLQCPSLFVRGLQSDMFAAPTADKVRETNPRAEVIEMNTGHDVAGEDPAGVIAAVGQFLARHDL